MNEREDPLMPPESDEVEGELVDEGDSGHRSQAGPGSPAAVAVIRAAEEATIAAAAVDAA
jgi:hypothetical protein